MISLMKQHQIDSLGIGRYVRNRIGYEQWKKMNWRQELQNFRSNARLTFTSKITVNLDNTWEDPN